MLVDILIFPIHHKQNLEVDFLIQFPYEKRPRILAYFGKIFLKAEEKEPPLFLTPPHSV